MKSISSSHPTKKKVIYSKEGVRKIGKNEKYFFIGLIGILLCTFFPLTTYGESTTTKEVKNVIFMIPDGYSAAYATNYRWFKGSEPLMDRMLIGMVKTYSASSKVTDSAAAGTAMATGVKTKNGMISVSPKGKKATYNSGSSKLMQVRPPG